MNGIVFDIEKFAIHDGIGIRTEVILKGSTAETAWKPATPTRVGGQGLRVEMTA
jgi:hypothetical protein